MKKRLDRNMLSVIFALAWPTMLEELMQTAVQYIDTAMVGTLGTQATAAVGATGTVSWLVGSTVSAVGVGFLALISQSYGAGDKERAKRASAQAVMMTLVVGLLFTAITTLLSGKITQWMQVDVSIRAMASQYFLILYSPMLFRTASIIFATVLRSVGDTKTPMRVSLNMNLINIVLNFLLIYSSREVRLLGLTIPIWGVGWGINGAAVASAVAYTYGGIAMTVRLWKHPDLSPKGYRFLPDVEILRPCWKVAFPNMLQRFGTSLGYVAFAAMINALGDTSTAAHTIANTVESLFYIPGWGMQTAAATLAGNAMGARDGKKLKSLAGTLLPLEVGLMGTTVLRMVAVSEPFYGVPIVLEGIMQGTGRTVPPFVFNILGMWCVRIFGTFICTRFLGLGLIAAWGCMIGHNLLLFALFAALFVTGRIYPASLREEH